MNQASYRNFVCLLKSVSAPGTPLHICLVVWRSRFPIVNKIGQGFKESNVKITYSA